jgi:hypothetical protein
MQVHVHIPLVDAGKLLTFLTGAQILIANINDTRAMLAGMNLKKQLPVGNSDAGAYFNNMVLAAIDYGVCLHFLPFHGIVMPF